MPHYPIFVVVSSSPALCPFDMLLPGSSFCCRPPCLWGADVESFVVLVSLLPTFLAYRSGIEEAKERARSLDTIPESLSYLSEYSTGLGATAASASSPQVSVSSAYLLHGEKSSPASIWNGVQSLSLKLLLHSNSNIERFSNDCRKIKTKVITSTNHNRNKQRHEPIRIISNHL